MTEHSFEHILDGLKESVRDPRTPSDVRQAVLSSIKKLRKFVQESEEDGCPNCDGGPDFKVLKMVPVDGWTAVFAESDDQDPQKMCVEPVLFFALLEFLDGESMVVSGMCANGEQILPCFPIATFVGYVPPGKSPDMHADRVRKRIQELKDLQSEEEKSSS